MYDSICACCGAKDLSVAGRLRAALLTFDRIQKRGIAEMPIAAISLPEDALLQRYAMRPDCYTDCFSTTLDAPVDLATFIEAFYTAPLFRLERVILRFAGFKSSDAEARAVAQGDITRFAAWSIEGRCETELLMCDAGKRTRSWFRVEGARVYFGSAVVPAREGAGLRLGFRRCWGRIRPIRGRCCGTRRGDWGRGDGFTFTSYH